MVIRNQSVADNTLCWVVVCAVLAGVLIGLPVTDKNKFASYTDTTGIVKNYTSSVNTTSSDIPPIVSCMCLSGGNYSYCSTLKHSNYTGFCKGDNTYCCAQSCINDACTCVLQQPDPLCNMTRNYMYHITYVMAYMYFESNEYRVHYSHQNVSCRLLDDCPERNFVNGTSKNIYYENNDPFTFYFGGSPSFSYSGAQVTSIVFGSIFLFVGFMTGIIGLSLATSP